MGHPDDGGGTCLGAMWESDFSSLCNNEIYELKERQGLVSQDHHLQDIVVHQEGMQLEVVVNKTKQQVPFYAWVFHLQEVPYHLFHMDLPPTLLRPWEW